MLLESLSPDSLDAQGRGYPRPQLRRSAWISLNGTWDFAMDEQGSLRDPDQVQWTQTIRVPFAPEAPASGIGRTDFFHVCWYRRQFELPALAEGECLQLHFGAVDYVAVVWINGIRVCRHEGGYTPFTCDLTGVQGDHCEVIVRVEDDPADLA